MAIFHLEFKVSLILGLKENSYGMMPRVEETVQTEQMLRLLPLFPEKGTRCCIPLPYFLHAKERLASA